MPPWTGDVAVTLWAGTEPMDYPDPDPDDLTRDELAETYPAVYAVALALDEWLHREHGILSSRHHAGAFLDYLALQGYEVVEKPPVPPLSDLLPIPATLFPG